MENNKILSYIYLRCYLIMSAKLRYLHIKLRPSWRQMWQRQLQRQQGIRHRYRHRGPWSMRSSIFHHQRWYILQQLYHSRWRSCFLCKYQRLLRLRRQPQRHLHHSRGLLHKHHHLRHILHRKQFEQRQLRGGR